VATALKNAIVGELIGKQLTSVPASIISLTHFKTTKPEGTVLSRDSGLSDFYLYGMNSHPGYDCVDGPPFLFFDETDPRLLLMERVVAVTIGDTSVAVLLSVLEMERVVNYTIDGQGTVVFFKPGTLAAPNDSYIEASRYVGVTSVFDPNVNGQKLTSRLECDDLMDDETASQWNILGEATQGPMKAAG
jgi:hypothetical protein